MYQALCRSGALAVALLLGTVTWGHAQEPQPGGTFIAALEGEPATLTAHLTTDAVAVSVASNIFSNLIGLDYDFNPVPELAKSWTVSEDGLTYTFNLEENAQWHDGQPVTAADVEYTFAEVLAKVHPRGSSWWPNVESAKALDTHTFEVKLKSPYAPFLTMIASTLSSGALILPKHIYEGADPRTNPANLKPVGSGPFKFEAWEAGNNIVLVKNENYWKPNLPYLDRIVFRFTPDEASRLIAFEAGDVDFLHSYIMPIDQAQRLRADDRFTVVNSGLEAVAPNDFLLFNLRNEALSKLEVRQALAHAIDRKEVAAKSTFSEGVPANSFVNSSLHWLFTEEGNYSFDPAQAEKMLDAAGYPRKQDGTRFELRLVWATGRPYEARAGEVVKDQLSRIGVTVVAQAMERTTFIEEVFTNWNFDMAVQGFTTGPDPTFNVTPRYHTAQIKKIPFVNAMGYSNPKLDELFDSEYKMLDRGERAESWKEVQRILMADLPALPLFELTQTSAFSAKFKDVITGPLGV